jgi:hypothetical protein
MSANAVCATAVCAVYLRYFEKSFGRSRAAAAFS